MHTFDVHMTPALTRRAWNTWFFARGSHWKLGAAFSLILIGAWLDMRGGWDKNPPSTLTIVTLTTVGFGVVLFTIGYVIGLRRALAQQARMLDGRCTYTLTAENISFVNSIGSASLIWTTLAEIVRSGDFLRLHYTNGSASSPPLAQIPPEALAFLLAQARANGIKVTGF